MRRPIIVVVWLGYVENRQRQIVSVGWGGGYSYAFIGMCTVWGGGLFCTCRDYRWYEIPVFRWITYMRRWIFLDVLWALLFELVKLPISLVPPLEQYHGYCDD